MAVSLLSCRDGVRVVDLSAVAWLAQCEGVVSRLSASGRPSDSNMLVAYLQSIVEDSNHVKSLFSKGSPLHLVVDHSWCCVAARCCYNKMQQDGGLACNDLLTIWDRSRLNESLIMHTYARNAVAACSGANGRLSDSLLCELQHCSELHTSHGPNSVHFHTRST